MEVFEATIEDNIIIYSDPTRDVYCYIFDREDFSSFKEVCKGEDQGIYILQSRKSGKLYIGEGKFKNRISSHIENKDFWCRALVFNSTIPEKFHKSYLEFFEASFIKKAIINDIPIENGQGGKKGLEDAKSKAYFRVMEEIIRVSTMSDIFTSVKQIEVQTISKKADSNPLNGEYFFGSKNKGIEGILLISDGVYTLKSGSICANFYRPYITGAGRELKEKYMEDTGLDTFKLKEDLDFTSPSAAAVFLTGISMNGQEFWRNTENNLTINEILETITS